jgi:hypothetical protein
LHVQLRNFTAGYSFHYLTQATEFFDRLQKEIALMADCGVILYQAGGYQQHDDGSTNWGALIEIHNNTMKACWEYCQ